MPAGMDHQERINHSGPLDGLTSVNTDVNKDRMDRQIGGVTAFHGIIEGSVFSSDSANHDGPLPDHLRRT